MINQFYKYKIGSGFDFHRISKTNKENKIALCGLHIPANFQIIAHSDGDVGLHALTEAILGSVAAGNIGQTFPSSDSRFKNADSSLFLLHAIDILLQQNASIVNIDITFICEIPQIMPHAISMRERLSSLLTIPFSDISIKATTTEKMGAIGRKEGIGAHAICMIRIPE